MDYNTLIGTKATKGTIANWVNYTDVILPLVDILTEAQAIIYKSLRCREMIVSDAAIVLAQGALNAPLPAGFLDPINFRDKYNIRLKARDLSTVKRARMIDPTTNSWVQGLPRQFAIAGATLELDFPPDASSAGTFLLDYYGAPAALGPSNLSNFVTIRYPTLMRYACLAMAADFLNDQQRVAAWTERVAGEIAEIEANDELALRGAEVVPDYSEAY